MAFAVTVAGEAALLAGDLDAARADLSEAVALHVEMAADTGTAHTLQRLAEVELAAGDRARGRAAAAAGAPLARWSPLARHLLQRIYGTLIAAAPDADAALAVVDEAVERLDGPFACMFCQVMIAVPASIACIEGGRLDEARAWLAQATRIRSQLARHGMAGSGHRGSRPPGAGGRRRRCCQSSLRRSGEAVRGRRTTARRAALP